MTAKRIKLRPEVAAFAEEMERALQENEHKGGWRECSRMYLLACLREEQQELYYELIRNPPCDYAIRKEAADVANFAMMIADVCEFL